MTVAKEPDTSLADRIQHDLKSVTTTTEQTLNLLRAVLGLESDSDSDGKDSTRTTKLVPPKRSRNLSGRPAVALVDRSRKSATKFEVHQNPENPPQTLSGPARRKHAADYFNSALKSLTSCAKDKVQYNQVRTDAKQLQDVQACSKPLQECSPNRKKKPDREKNISESSEGIVATIKCASSALDSLRSIQTNDDGNEVDLDIENGAVILLDRTISLKVLADAETQIRKIYEQYWKRRKTVGTLCIPPRDSQNLVATCLRLESEPNKSAFRLTTAFQSQVLRYAILTGGSVVDENFVTNVQPDVVGSPACIIRHGVEAGYLDQGTAGQQMRTLSLALLKLYSSGLTSDRSTVEKTDCKLKLAFIALQIKCFAWKLLKQEPDLEVELWSHASRVIKRFVSANKDSDQMHKLLKQCIVSLQETTLSSGFDPSIPAGLKKSFPFLAQKSGNTTDSLQITQVDENNDVSEFLSACRIMIENLEGLPATVHACLSTGNQLLDHFSRISAIHGTSWNEVLVSGVRVRKAATLAVTAIQHMTFYGNDVGLRSQSQGTCIRIIHAFLEHLKQLMTSLTKFTEDGIHTSDKPNVLDNIILAVAKTIEAVIQVEKLPNRGHTLPFNESSAAFQNCLRIGHGVCALSFSTKQSDVIQYLQSLPVRISQLYWSRFLFSAEQRQPTHQSLEILRHSIAALEGQPLVEQTAGFLGVKYERLAVCYVDMKEYSAAKAALTSAITFTVKQGALSDIVDLLVLNPFSTIWDSGVSRTGGLGKSLSSFAKLSLDHKLLDDAGLWFFDDEKLPSLHRCVMLERQLITALEISISSLSRTSLAPVVDRILKLSSARKYRNYQRKLVSKLLGLIGKAKDLNIGHFFTECFIQKLSIIEETEVDDLLWPESSASLATTLACQYAFSIGTIDESLIVKFVADFEGVLAKHQQFAESLVKNCDVAICITQLTALADFAGVIGDDDAQLRALNCIRVLRREQEASDPQNMVLVLTRIATLQLRLQDSLTAGKTIGEAEKLLRDGSESSIASLTWHLAYADYLFNISNVDKCKTVIQSAQVMFDRMFKSHEDVSSQFRVQRDTILCQALQLASQMAFRNGSLLEATIYARRAVKLSTGLWLSIEKSCKNRNGSNNDTSVQSLGKDVSNLTISSKDGQEFRKIQGMAYWFQIATHRSLLQLMGQVSAHNGLYQDAVFYYQQAQKFCGLTASAKISNGVLSHLALLYANAEQNSSASAFLSQLQDVTLSKHISVEVDESIINQGEAYLRLKDFEAASQCFSAIQTFYDRLGPELVSEDDPPAKESVKISQSVKKRLANGTSGSKPRARTLKKNPRADQTELNKQATTETQPILRSWRQERLAIRIETFRKSLQLYHHETAKLDNALMRTGLAMNSMADHRLLVLGALIKLQEAFQAFSLDPVNSVLAETAMALPVRYRSARKSGRISFMLQATTQDSRKTGSARKAISPKGADNSGNVTTDTGRQALGKAYQLLGTIEGQGTGDLSSDMVDLMHKTLSQIGLLSTALSHPLTHSSLELVLQSLVSKDVARMRESFSRRAEEESCHISQAQTWPSPEMDISLRQTPELCASDLKNFVDDLPSTWSVISLGLNHDTTELLLSKITSERSPFLMRVPLARPGMENDDETEELTLAKAKAELEEIVQKANLSAHDKRGQGDKATRKAWYAEREALDKRLELLLADIENIWLGGFRGVLGGCPVDDFLLSRFGQSLNVALEKHLPSRQKVSKSQTDRVELHAHVLELFTSMDFKEGPEFEDAILDLLYFVVDVLQFSGEPNAYDEVDFDAILVEVLAALHACHDASESNSRKQSRHIILIVDKELQSFPWECLPCLKNRSVSRMPSLLSIKERLDRIRNQDPTSDCYTVPATSGAYMLNPSSDLKSTQEAFEKPFHTQMQQFSSMINQKPTEAEFEACLRDNTLFLYFGHGSGAQYIRGRTIRKMDHCAVTLLMGCSSAKMTECGIYEPYGMPWHYIIGGSPAVLGTLWDVTDRDIDRFAMKTMVEWGLLEDDEHTEKVLARVGTKGKGKGKATTRKKADKEKSNERRGTVALDEAVSRARDSCMLRYLNGAAPVIYGVPVVLK